MSSLVISLPFFLLHNDKNADDENINRVDVPVFLCLHKHMCVKLIFSGLSHVDVDGVTRMDIGESVVLFQHI